MAYGVITLGREICSGGCDIAKEAARELGLPYYDKELITIAAKKSGLSEEAIAASEAPHRQPDVQPVHHGQPASSGRPGVHPAKPHH